MSERTIREAGCWDTRPKVDEARKTAARKMRSVNKDRALAARYGLYKYPPRRPS